MRTPLTLLALFVAAPAAAHHSLNMYGYTPATIIGEVEAFHFVNPHPYVVLKVAGPAAVAGRWKVELDNRFELEPAGMRADTYRPGDRLIATGRPETDGKQAMYMLRLERPADGLVWSQASASPQLVTPGRTGRR